MYVPSWTHQTDLALASFGLNPCNGRSYILRGCRTVTNQVLRAAQHPRQAHQLGSTQHTLKELMVLARQDVPVKLTSKINTALGGAYTILHVQRSGDALG